MGLSFGSAQEISQKLCTNALHYDPVEYDKTGAGRGRQPSTFYGFPLEDTALLQSETTDLSCRWRLRGALRSFHWHFVWWGGRIGRRCGWVKLTGTNPRGRAAEMGHRIGFRFSRWRREPTTEAMWLMEFLSNEFIRNIIKKKKKTYLYYLSPIMDTCTCSERWKGNVQNFGSLCPPKSFQIHMCMHVWSLIRQDNIYMYLNWWNCSTDHDNFEDGHADKNDEPLIYLSMSTSVIRVSLIGLKWT